MRWFRRSQPDTSGAPSSAPAVDPAPRATATLSNGPTPRPAPAGATCDACIVQQRKPEFQGELQVFTPYAGYPVEATLHPDCERLARRTTQRCWWSVSSAHRAGARGPLLLWFGEEDAEGLPVVAHEACALGGAFLRPDGSLKAQCMICFKVRRDVARYDLGEGEMAWLDRGCAGRAGLGPKTAGQAFTEGLAIGAVLAAIGHGVRRDH